MSDSQSQGILENYPPLLTVGQVAEIFQVTPLTIKRWGKKGILPPIRINSRGDRRYTKEQVLWLIGQRQETQPEPSVNKNLYIEEDISQANDNAPGNKRITDSKPKNTVEKPVRIEEKTTRYSF